MWELLTKWCGENSFFITIIMLDVMVIIEILKKKSCTLSHLAQYMVYIDEFS